MDGTARALLRAFGTACAALLALAPAPGAAAQDAAPAGAAAGEPSYATFVDPELGFRVDYPADLVAPAPGPPAGGRRAFLPEDGPFRMAVESAPGAELDAAYAREREALGDGASYRRRLDGAFAVSGIVGGDVVYVRAFVADDGLRILRLRYPAELKPELDPVTTRASLTFGPAEGGESTPDAAEAAPPPAPAAAPPAEAPAAGAPTDAPPPPAALAPFVGDWRSVVNLPEGSTEVRLRIRADGGALEVALEARRPDEAAFAPRGRVEDAVLADGSVTWIWRRGGGSEVQGVVPAGERLFVTFEGVGAVPFEREP